MNQLLSAKDKIRYALDRVRDRLPIAVPLVLARWEVIEDTSGATKTARTNGKVLWYNPEFIDSLTLDEVSVLILHEAGHPLYNHPLRFRLWLAKHAVEETTPKAKAMHAVHNIAADLALNSLFLPIYTEWNGLSMVEKGCFPRSGTYAGLPEGQSLDYYLAQLWDDKKNKPMPPEGTRVNLGKGHDEDNPKEGEDHEGSGEDGEGEGDEEGEDGDAEDGDDEGEGDAEGDGEGEGEGEGEGKGKGKGKPDGDDGSEGEGGDGTGTMKEGDDGNAEVKEGEGKGEPTKTQAEIEMETNVFGEYDAAPIEDVTKDSKEMIEDLEEQEREWRRAVAQAVVMQKDTGDGAGDAVTDSLREDALIDQPDDSNWIVELQRFLTRYAPGGYTFTRMSRRHAYRTDIIFPEAKARNAGSGLIIVDTSGSMGDAECNRSLVEIERILQRYPNSTVMMISCDTKVYVGRKYQPSDFPIDDFEGWKGRGGTDLSPAFRWAAANKRDYDWLVCVTDMWWNYPEVIDPGIPTFWLHVAANDVDAYAAFGEVPFGIYCRMPPAGMTA